MALLPDLVGRIRLDMSELNRAQGEASSRGAAIGSALGTAVGSLAGGLLAAAGEKVLTFVSGSIDAFAQLEDATSVTGIKFGDFAGDVENFATSADKSFGLSKRAALEAANTFGTFGKAAELTGKPLADFSTQMTGLAGDMASFSGTTPDEAVQALGAAFRGEYDPIERYGVLINKEMVNQKALQMGLAATKDEITKGDEVMATRQLILEQTGQAQGDFARTGDSVANSQKRVSAETENAQAALGEKLAPAYLVVLNALNQVITGVTAFIDVIGRVITWVGQYKELLVGLAAVLLILNARTIAFNAAMAAQLAWMSIVNILNALRTAWWALNAAMAANPIGVVIAVVAALAAGIIYAYNHSETFRAIVDKLFAKLKEFVDWCGPAIEAWASKVGTSFMQAVHDLEAFGSAVNSWIEKMRVSLVQAGTDIGNWGTKMKDSLVQAGTDMDTFGSKVNELPGKAQAGLSNYFGILQAQVITAWNRTRDGSVAAINTLVTEGGALVGKVQSALAPFVGMLRDKVIAAWEALPPGIRQPIEQVVNAAIKMGRDIINSLVNLPSQMVQMGQDIIGGLLRGLQARGQEIVTYLTNLIPGPVRKALGISSPSRVMAEIGDQTMQGLINGMQALLPQVDATLSKILEIINSVKSALGIHSPSSLMHEMGEFIMQGLDQGLETWIPKIQSTLDKVLSMVQQHTSELGQVAEDGSKVAAGFYDEIMVKGKIFKKGEAGYLNALAKVAPGLVDKAKQVGGAVENWSNAVPAIMRALPGLQNIDQLFSRGTGGRIGVNVGNLPKGATDALYAAGFRGDPTDKAERMYAPAGGITNIDARSFGTQLRPEDVVDQIKWASKIGGLVSA